MSHGGKEPGPGRLEQLLDEQLGVGPSEGEDLLGEIGDAFAAPQHVTDAPSDELMNLDRAVASLSAQLSKEKVFGPSQLDLINPAAAKRANRGGVGRVVSEPPAPYDPDRDSALGLSPPPLGADGPRPMPVDTGPMPGDPFSGRTPSQPGIRPGQSHLGLGVAGDAFPNDFYGRDNTTPPPGPRPPGGPSYGETAGYGRPDDPWDARVHDASQAAPTGIDPNLFYAEPEAPTPVGTSGWVPSRDSRDSQDVAVAPAVALDGNTQRTAIEPQTDSAIAMRRGPRYLPLFALLGVIIGAAAVAIAMKML